MKINKSCEICGRRAKKKALEAGQSRCMKHFKDDTEQSFDNKFKGSTPEDLDRVFGLKGGK